MSLQNDAAMHLYEMTEAYQQLMDLDLPDEDLAQYIDGIEGQIAQKAESVALVVLDLEGTAKKLRDEEKRLADRRRSLQNRAEGLKSYLLQNLQAVGLNKIDGTRATVSYQNSPPSCNVLDLDALPDDCKALVPATWKADARAIIARWKNTGEQVPGAEVWQGVHLRIR